MFFKQISRSRKEKKNQIKMRQVVAMLLYSFSIKYAISNFQANDEEFNDLLETSNIQKLETTNCHQSIPVI